MPRYEGDQLADAVIHQAIKELQHHSKPPSTALIRVLGYCRAQVVEELDRGLAKVTITIDGPDLLLAYLRRLDNLQSWRLDKAIYDAALSVGASQLADATTGPPLVSTRVRAGYLANHDRDALLDILKCAASLLPEASNQGVGDADAREWESLRFRSQTEIRIAEALDERQVLFFPNCAARVGMEQDRRKVEPDFLVCDDGRWGILEIDGDPFHLPQRAHQEHRRDRLFKRHGVRVVERYSADLCHDQPDVVVDEFLKLLAKAYS